MVTSHLALAVLVAAALPAAAASGSAVYAFGDATAFAGESPERAAAAVATPAGDGLLVASTDGEVAAFGRATHRGAAVGQTRGVVAIARTPAGAGYWLFARDGGVFAFGDAGFLGSLGDVALNQPVVAGAATPTGRGYWLFARDGGVFGFGDAAFHGSLGDVALNQPVVAGAATPTGRGYWLFARDGGVFAFGDAAFHGSLGDIALNQPVVGGAATPAGRGYWLVARDGGVFAIGDARFHGSAAGLLPAGYVAAAIAPSRDGYWVVPRRADVRLVAAGDVHGERHVGDRVRSGEPLFAGMGGVMAAADVAAVNLETPVGPPGTPQPKQYVFLAPAELLTALAAEGVDVVSLANNHALDHGAAAMLRTRDAARRAGLLPVGAGANASEAYAPVYLDVGPNRVGVVGLSMVVPPGWAATATGPGVASAYDTRRATAAVREAAGNADVVLVLVHWGVELSRCPDGSVVRLADALHAAGADVVAGHHPHVLQGVDARADRVTAYSLGNFVWYHDEPPSDLTGVLDATVGDSGASTSFHPARVRADGTPALLSGGEADAVRAAVVGGPCWHP